jgi:protein-tyrosine phosphatase
MSYSIVFFLIASILVSHAWGSRQWILLYPAISFGVVSFAYLTNSAMIFGKRMNGRLGVINKMVFFPYLAYVWLTWHMINTIRRERAYDQLTPDLIIGRRTRFIPDNVKSVVDLTCEFEEYDDLLEKHVYFSFPILDGCPPDAIYFLPVIERIGKLPRPIYMHCAEGHGRTGMVAAALLLYEQHVGSIAEAMRLIQSVRPKAKIQKSQYKILQLMVCNKN